MVEIDNTPGPPPGGAGGVFSPRDVRRLFLLAVFVLTLSLALVEIFAPADVRVGWSLSAYLLLGFFAVWLPQRRRLWTWIALALVPMPWLNGNADLPSPRQMSERCVGVLAIWLVGSLSRERQGIESKLRDREEYHRLLEETLGVVPWEMEFPSSGLAWIGPQAKRLLGYPLERWRENGFWESLLHPDDRDWTLRQRRESAARGENHETEYRLRAMDGSIHWFRDIVTVESRARQVRLRGFLVEVTAAHREQERTRAILETTPDGYLLANRAGILLDVNQAFCNQCGRPRSELIGKPISEIEIPGASGGLTERIQRGLADGHERVETRLRGHPGRRIDVEFSLSLLDDSGERVVAFCRDITPRKQDENALREQGELLRLFVEHAPAAVAMLDTDLRYVIASRRWRSDYKLGEVPIIGRSHYEVFPEIPERWREIHRRGLAGEVMRCEEDAFLRADGQTDWLRWEIHPWRHASGEIGGIIMFTEVITRPRQSEERFRRIFELPIIGMAITSPDKGWLEVNDTLCEMLGYPREELRQLTWSRLTHPDDLDKDVAQFERTLAGEIDGYSLDKRFARKDGTWLESSLSVHCLRRPDRSVESFVALVQDIGHRKQAERSLRESERRFRAIFDQTFELVALMRPDGTILEVNQTALRFAGLQREDLVGKRLWDRGPTHQTMEFRRRLKDSVASAANGQFVRYESEVRGEDGKVAVIDVSVKPVRDDDGNVSLLLVEARDITIPKQVEQERRRLEKQIQDAQKLESLGILAGGIAHDFNNLLVGIMGHAGLALMELEGNPRARDSLRQIELSAQRAAELTNQMLAYSGKGKFVVEPVDLSNLAKEMAHLLETVISKKAALHMEFAPAIPPVEADASQLRQVLMNLITNASDALGDNPGTITIKTGVAQIDPADKTSIASRGELPPGEYVCVEVSDTGCGMDEDTQLKIFDPFFTTKFTGRGLGLAAVQGIIRGHGGAISVTSKPHLGATFRVLLPPARDQKTRKADIPLDTAQWRGSGTVLVIDDEETVRDVARKTLERFGYDVLTAKDGQEGIEQFLSHANQISWILLDMTMPRMDGEETYREICKINHDVRVILTSGYTEQEAIGRFSGKGLAGFIQKPFRPLALIETLRACSENPSF